MIAISYRREDSLPIAGRLYDRLEAKFGKENVFMDFDSIRPGLDFRQQIKDTIEGSKVMITMIGPNWMGQKSDGSRRIDDPADFVRLEMDYALRCGIPIIPVLINNTSMPKPEELPPDIQGLAFRHALPLDTGLDFRQHAERLIASISDLIPVSHAQTGHGRSAAEIPVKIGSAARERNLPVWLVMLLVAAGVAIAWFVARNPPTKEANRVNLVESRTPAPTTPNESGALTQSGRSQVSTASSPIVEAASPAPTSEPAVTIPSGVAVNTQPTGPATAEASATSLATPKPRLLYAPAPSFPPGQSLRGQSGTGRFRLTFDAQGNVTDIRVVASTGNPYFDQAAIKTLRQWKSAPNQGWQATVPVTFRTR